MEGWRKYFIISGCTHFVLPGIGEINASNDNLDISKLEKAWQRKCPYVSLTSEGITKYAPEKKPIEIKKIEYSSGGTYKVDSRTGNMPEEKPKKSKSKIYNQKKPE